MMMPSPRNDAQGPSSNRITALPRVVLLLIFLLLLSAADRLAAQTLATFGFEDGTDNWVSFNGASAPVQSGLAAEAGSDSLLTTTNSTGLSSGPSINLTSTLQPGATYSITGFLELSSPASGVTANFTIMRTDHTDTTCSGGTCFDTVGSFQVPVNGSGFTQIGGTYTVPLTATGVTLYAQLTGGVSSAQSFYLDNVVITETAPPPGGTPIASYTFADGTDGWKPFGTPNPTLAAVTSPTPDPNGNSTSLLTSNRSAAAAGPSLNLLGVPQVVAGATYQVTAFVMLAAPDSSNPAITLSTDTSDCASSGNLASLATTTTLSSTQWTKVQGTFSFSNIPGPPTGLELVFQSGSATDSFYVSDVVITQIAPPPPDPGQQDNSGISTTFEDGGLDGWSGRISSTLTNSTATAHGGTHSLLVTGRSSNFDGPEIGVSNKMFPGSKYNVSVWVKIDASDSSTHVINMSLQYTLNGQQSFPSISPFPGVSVPADGNFHQISVNGFTMPTAIDPGSAFVYLQSEATSGNDLVSFFIDDFQVTFVPPPTIQTDIPSIYKTLAEFFPVGAEVDTNDLSGPHAQLLTMHFDSLVSGNDMKWSSVENTKGVFTYSNADAEVGLAVCNNMHVRGHNLVWATGAQTPAYAFGDGTSSASNQATVTANIQEHIQSEVQHFGKKVFVWDVVNEPIDATQPDCLFHGPFYQVLGKSYIDVALQAARQYAPAGTKLFLNDYNTTADPAKLACLMSVVGDLRSRGIPIDGIGHEMHNSINFPAPDGVTTAVNSIHDSFPDLDQQVTEMDISVYNGGDSTTNYGLNVPPAVIAEQGWLYKAYFDVYRQLAGKLSFVTFWGFADDDTWLDGARTDYPLPFDMGLQAKPAYWGIVDPTQLPGFGLRFAMTGDTVTSHQNMNFAHAVTLTAANGEAGPAYATQITGLTVTQTSGKPCTAVVTPPASFPVSLGDIAAGGTASATFNISFPGCTPSGRFTIAAPWSSSVYHTGSFTAELSLQQDNVTH